MSGEGLSVSFKRTQATTKSNSELWSKAKQKIKQLMEHQYAK